MRYSPIPALVLAMLALGVPMAAAAPLNRPEDPVVVTGAGTPALLGVPPGDVVAFAWAGAWQQIPVQVDERKLFDLRAAYPTPFDCAGSNDCFPPFSTPAKLRYADAGTLVGADNDPALDANDEIAFMAKDTGSETGAVADPAGVVAGSRVLVRVTDPLNGGVGYAYLFRRSGGLDPGAGQQYVNYTFSLASGAYPATYRFSAGTNTENSTVVTPRYSRTFIDRWRESGLTIASGPDILDRAENQFFPDECGRSTLTFARGEGAFLVNRNGPVRAIRAFVGANSGPMTERQQVFYEGREEDTTYLRVHPIPAIMSFFDYSAAATGMTYRNNNNLAGVTIDGVADTVTPGALTWESVDGPQGALTSVHTWNTTVAASKFTSFYRDAASPPAGQTPCQGDSGFYGAGGPYVNGAINSTDEPANGNAPSDRLTTTRTMFFGAAGSANGPLRRSQVTAPLTTNLDPRPPVVVPPARPRPTTPSPTLPHTEPIPPKAKRTVRLSLGLRYHRARGCTRRAAVLTVQGTGLRQILRVGLANHSKTRVTDRDRPFRITVTKKRLRGHARGVVVVRARLAGGRLVTMKHRVRGLC